MMEVENEVTYIDSSFSLFGERKSIVYRIPQTGDTIVAHAASNDTCFAQDASNMSSRYCRQSLFAEHIWPGALVIADYLVDHSELCSGKSILELGAGVALPSIVASKLGAKTVVCSDFPDAILQNNVQALASVNNCKSFFVEPYRWGDDPVNLLVHLFADDKEVMGSKFDVIILAECLWKDTYLQHSQLWKSVVQCSYPCSSTLATVILISFAHRPCDGHTALNDLEFLTMGERYGFDCSLISTVDKYHDAMENEIVTEYIYKAIRKTTTVD